MPYIKKSSGRKKFEGQQPGFIQGEPVVSFRPPKCPKDLPKEAKSIWNNLAPDLIQAKKLNQFTAPIFREYCIVVMTLQDLDKAIYATNRSLLEQTRLYDAGTGKEENEYKESALSKIRRMHWVQLEKFSKTLGFTFIAFEGHYRYEDTEHESELI